VKRLIGWILAVIGGAGTMYAIYLYLGPQKGLMFGYDPVFAGLATIAVLTFGIILTQNH
jgi:hypothetical protein